MSATIFGQIFIPSAKFSLGDFSKLSSPLQEAKDGQLFNSRSEMEN